MESNATGKDTNGRQDQERVELLHLLFQETISRLGFIRFDEKGFLCGEDRRGLTIHHDRTAADVENPAPCAPRAEDDRSWSYYIFPGQG